MRPIRVAFPPEAAIVISQGAPYVQDAVVTGLNRSSIGLLVFPRIDHCTELSGLPAGTPAAEVLASEPVRSHFKRLLDALNVDATGSSKRIERMLLLAEPPSIDHREQTDKGSINQAAVLNRRAALVDVATWARDSLGASVLGFASSGLPGPAGNQETFVWLAEAGRSGDVDDIEAAAREVEP